MSRRTFIAGAATAALAANSDNSLVRASMTEPRTDSQPAKFDQPGNPSRKAHRVYAETEYEHYQQKMGERPAQQGDPGGGNSSGNGSEGDENGSGKPTAPKFSQTVDAVEEFGVDPKGNRPIGEDIGSVPENTLVVFPGGTFKVSGRTQFRATKAGVVGTSYKDKKPPSGDGKNTTTFVAEQGTFAALDFKMDTGLVGDFMLDFTATKALITMNARSSGFVQYRDVVWKGLVDRIGSQANDSKNGDYLCAMQPENGATSRATRFVMKNNGIPGSKNIGGRNGFWCGETCKGTAQIEDCVVSAIADNGVYGGRAPGNVQIKGGEWVNNEVSHNRYSGKGSFSDGATMILDADSYNGPTGSYGKWNAEIGTHAVKIERGDNGISKPSGAVLRNAEIQLLSAGPHGFGAGIRVRGSGGALKIENCRLTNNVDCASVVAESPGDGYSGYTAPSPHNIAIADSLFQGTSAESIIDVSGRANSLIRNTCFKIPGASSSSITGMKIGSGVGFGKQCKSGGLSDPQKVGSGGNLSAANFSAPNASYTGGTSANSGGSGWSGKLLGGLAVAPLIGIAVIALPLIVGLLLLGGITFGGLLLFFKKLSG